MIIGTYQNKNDLKELEKLREELYNAYKNKADKEIIFEISRKIDTLIVEYYRKIQTPLNKDKNKDESLNAR